MTSSAEREPLLEALARYWERRDPMPLDLPDKILVNLAAHDLDVEYEILTLMHRSSDLAGARGGLGTPVLVEFSSEEYAVTLRITAVENDVRRIDGWCTPAGEMPTFAHLRQGEKDRRADVTRLGRFEFAAIPAGSYRLVLSAPANDDGHTSCTHPFDI